jgi:hypothetical protein
LSDLAIKSHVQHFVDRAKGAIEKAPAASPLSYVREAGTTTGMFVEAGLIGALLGATHAKFGLDKGNVPVDAALALAGYVAGVALSGHSPAWATLAARAGSDAFAVFAFRRSFELVAKGPLSPRSGQAATRIAPSKKTGGSKDPIITTAEKLDGQV